MRYVCNFCGSAHKKGDFFILGLDGVICEECVISCKKLMLRKRFERQTDTEKSKLFKGRSGEAYC